MSFLDIRDMDFSDIGDPEIPYLTCRMFLMHPFRLMTTSLSLLIFFGAICKALNH